MQPDHRRLREPIGYVSPAEFEAAHYRKEPRNEDAHEMPDSYCRPADEPGVDHREGNAQRRPQPDLSGTQYRPRGLALDGSSQLRGSRYLVSEGSSTLAA